MELDILKKKYPNSEILITGHSYGGAMATIQAAYLSSLG